MQEITLKTADAELLGTFFKNLGAEALARFTPHGISPAALRGVCTDPSDARLVAVNADGMPVAYAVLREIARPVPELLIAAAEPGCGYGTRTLELVKAYAREQNKTALRASVEPDNMRAHRLLGHHGFTQIGFTGGMNLLLLCDLRENPTPRGKLPEVSREYISRTGNRCTFRSLCADDGERLDAFFRQLDKKSRAFFTPHDLTRPFLETLCRDTAADINADRFIVTDTDGRIAGYVFLSALQSPLPSMGIGTAEWARGEGLGREMLRFIQNRARAYGLHAIRLSTHLTNYTAQKLYKTSGFEVIGTTSFGELLMLCDLGRVD